MSFLAPIFLLGATAIALPVLFHLIRRTTRDRTPFGSLMFLRPTPPHFTRRSRIQHWLLLALRCLALALLALGFARPFLPNQSAEPAPTAQARRTVLLVDASASLRRQDLWTQTLRAARDEIAAANPADDLALALFSTHVQTLVSFDDWRAIPPADRANQARARLDQATPTGAGTRLGAALVAAAEMLAEPGADPTPRHSRIVLISDLQEGCRLDPLQGFNWPKGVELVVHPVQARRSANATLQPLPEPDSTTTSNQPNVRIRVSNAPDSTRDQFQIGWSANHDTDLAPNPQTVYVPPGQSRVVSLPSPAPPASSECIRLLGDDEPFDNTTFVLPTTPARLAALYLGTDSGTERNQPLFFLQRALRETRHLAVTLSARPPTTPLPTTELAQANLIFVADPLADPLAAQVRDRLLAGATVLFTPKSAALSPTLNQLLNTNASPLTEFRPDREFALLGHIDLRHPLFAPFADPRFSDFSKLHVWHYRRLDPEAIPSARVLARFDSGDPALLEIPVGLGRLFFLATGWHPDDSQLALSSKFVPLLYALLDLAGAANHDSQPAFLAGEPIPLEPLRLGTNSPVTVLCPNNRTLTLPAGSTQFIDTSEPGIYRLTSAQSTNRIAVNLDPAESRLSPVAIEQFESLGAPVTTRTPTASPPAAERASLRAAEAESRQKLWRAFLIATLAILLIESTLAGWTARQPAPTV